MTYLCGNLKWNLNNNNNSSAVPDTLNEIMRNCKTFCKSVTIKIHINILIRTPLDFPLIQREMSSLQA